MVDVAKRRMTGLSDSNSDDLVEVDMEIITEVNFSTGLADTTSVAAGEDLTLTVALADGVGPYRVQWYKDGNAISGATGLTYTRADVTAADAGVYKAVAQDDFGDVIADSTAVTVTGA